MATSGCMGERNCYHGHVWLYGWLPWPRLAVWVKGTVTVTTSGCMDGKSLDSYQRLYGNHIGKLLC